MVQGPVVQGPVGDPILDKTAWHWPCDRIFKAPQTRQVYVKLKQSDGWFVPLNKIWGIEWSEANWTRCVEHLWTFKGSSLMKGFMWKVLWGAIPTGIKVRVRGIGTERVALEDPLHLFLKCPMVLGLIGKICKWVQRSLKIPCSKEDLILGGGVMANEAILSCTEVLIFFL